MWPVGASGMYDCLYSYSGASPALISSFLVYFIVRSGTFSSFSYFPDLIE